MKSLISQVLDWGAARGLHDTTDLKPQLTKLTEELGEIAAGVARDDRDRIIDGVGDLLVVLINFGAVFNNHWPHSETSRVFFMEDCLKRAYDIIEHRTGKTVDGVFVKDAADMYP
jgi:uncharacterized protein YabN with tetrapyrrole methylase and pyrophosphatase domain